MRRTIINIFSLTVMLMISITAQAQVQLSMPDIEATVGDTVKISVYADSSLTGLGAESFVGKITYNDYYLEPVAVDFDSTLFDDAGWEGVSNTTDPEVITIAGAGDTALSGTGKLVNVHFRILKAGYGYVNFTTADTYFNESASDIPLTFDNGLIRGIDRPTFNFWFNPSVVALGDSTQTSVSGNSGPVMWSVTDTAFASISTTGMLYTKAYGSVGVIAEDTLGIRDTAYVNILGFKLSASDTTNYSGQEVSVAINTSDLSSLDVSSGSFFLQTSMENNMEVLGIDPGTIMGADATITYSVKSNGIEIAFAQSELISGGGNLLNVRIKLKDDRTFNNYTTFQNAVMNESINGMGTYFYIRSVELPALSIGYTSQSRYLVGDSLQFTVTGNTGPVTWGVSDPALADITSDGMMHSKKGGKFRVNVTDSIEAYGETGEFTFYDVVVELPDSSMLLTDTLYYPVRLTNVERSMSSILSADFTVTYNNSQVNYLGFSTSGSLMDGWSVVDNQIAANKVKLVAGNATPVTTSGDLVYLAFKVDTSIHSDINTYLSLSDVLFNEGSPNQYIDNGRVFISTKPLTPVLVSPTYGQNTIPLTTTLDWEHSVGATNYQVQLSTTSSYATTFIDTTGVLGSELDVTGLAGSTNYYWRVKAINDSGESNWSSSWYFRTQDPVPATPTMYSPADSLTNTATAMNFSWSAVTYATAYRIEVDTSEVFATPMVDSTLGSTSFSLDSLMYNTSYYWRVYASNATGESAPSATRMFTTEDGLPEIPFLDGPDINQTGLDTTVTFIWLAAADADYYQFQLASDTLFASVIKDTVTSELTVTVDSLEFGTRYFWRVRAVNTVGSSDWSTGYFSTIEQVPGIPMLVSPAHNSIDQDTSVTFSWISDSLANTFTIQLSESEDFSPVLSEKNTSDTSAAFGNLDFLTTYFWRVKASNSGGDSDWSDTLSFTTKEFINQLPIVVNPLDSVTVDEDFGELLVAKLDTVFSDPDGQPLTFEIVEFDSIITAEIRNDSLIIGSLTNLNGISSVVVKATDDFAADTYDTLTVTVTPVNDAPFIVSLPDTLSFKVGEALSFVFDTSFADVEDDLLDLTVSVTVTPGDISATIDPVTMSVIFTSPSYTGLGLITFTVEDSDGGILTANIVINVQLSTSTEFGSGIPADFTMDQNYPNPFNPTSTIRFGVPKASEVQLIVYNMLGQKVKVLVDRQMQAGWHSVKFDASSLSSGTYVYRIKAGDFVQTRKMMLIK